MFNYIFLCLNISNIINYIFYFFIERITLVFGGYKKKGNKYTTVTVVNENTEASTPQRGLLSYTVNTRFVCARYQKLDPLSGGILSALNLVVVKELGNTNQSKLNLCGIISQQQFLLDTH